MVRESSKRRSRSVHITETSLEEARSQAADVAKQLLDGKDPARDREEAKRRRDDAITVSDLENKFLATQVEPRRKKNKSFGKSD